MRDNKKPLQMSKVGKGYLRKCIAYIEIPFFYFSKFKQFYSSEEVQYDKV